MTKQGYHHGDLKSELIQTGLKLLDQEGYENFSLRKVAKACNVSQTAPYRHFKDKEELIAAIAMEAMYRFNESLEQAVDQYPENPERQLSEMGVAYVRFFIEKPEYLRLLFLNNYKEKLEAIANHPYFQLNEVHPFETLEKAVERYRESSKETLSKEEMILFCWGMVHGITVLITTKQLPSEWDYLSYVRNIMDTKFLI